MRLNVALSSVSARQEALPYRTPSRQPLSAVPTSLPVAKPVACNACSDNPSLLRATAPRVLAPRSICQPAINSDCRRGATPAAFISLVYHEACTTTPPHDNDIAVRCARIQTYPRLSFPCNCASSHPRATATDRVPAVRNLQQPAPLHHIEQHSIHTPWRLFRPTPTCRAKDNFPPTCPRRTSSASLLYVFSLVTATTRHAIASIRKTY